MCPTCAWTLALQTGRTDVELRALTPPPDELEPLRRRLADPLLAVHLAEAILTAEQQPSYDDDVDPHTVALLAAVSAHAPTLLVPEECAEDPRSCKHRPEDLDWDDRSWRCPLPGWFRGLRGVQPARR